MYAAVPRIIPASVPRVIVGEWETSAEDVPPDAVAGPGLRQAEVEDLHLAVGGQLDVRGLQVAMDDAVLVGLFEPLGDLFRDRDGLVDGNRPALQALGQVFAFDQLHGEEVRRSSRPASVALSKP